MHTILTCIKHDHDGRLLALAALVCILGVYASFAVSSHAGRSQGRARSWWKAVTVVASSCTAWATHFIALLAFKPHTAAAFDPLLTVVSLFSAGIIGVALLVSAGRRVRAIRFAAGVTMGVGIGFLHYIGQSAYLVQGQIAWNLAMVLPSLLAAFAVAGLALVAAGERSHLVRAAGAPLLLLSIAVLHFSGMAAMTITYDPRVILPASAISPAAITPVVAGVCIGLLVLAVVGVRFDLAAKARARLDRQRLRALANMSLEGLLICDGDLIVSSNSSLERLSGLEGNQLVGHFASSLFPGIDLPTLPEREERDAELIGADGRPVPVRVLRSLVPVGHKVQTVIAIRDQSERLRAEAEIRTLAFSDPLTGLANRTRFAGLLELQAAWHREQGRDFALLMIDLDRFKLVNDTLGHPVGDLLLRKVADRLISTVHSGDIVARLGGDEFAVLQLDVRHPDWPAELASRIVEALGDQPFVVEGQSVHIGASVGVVLSNGTDDTAELLRNADLALYAAKGDGKGTFRFFEPVLDERMQERRTVEAGLRRALDQGELELHFQPLLDTATRRVTAAEALVRWRDPERGLIPPGDFIALAEETGLIIPLSEWVLQTACAEAALWPGGIRVAVNCSPVQFREARLASVVKAALDAAGLPPHRLELEITEGTLLVDQERTLATLNELREAGVHISMDDFGTGYSSLGYLRRFPFDKIKVDQSFVSQLPGDPESAAIVRAIVTMSRGMGMTTTMEGVETVEQLGFATDEGCDQVQGFLISRPLPAGDFRRFLSRGADHLPDPADTAADPQHALPLRAVRR
jgi:diguanylate cyclase (GGDEF)-like protein